jgi:hypothetical protein
VLGATAFVLAMAALAIKVYGFFWFATLYAAAVHDALKGALLKYFSERYSTRPRSPEMEDKCQLINRIAALQHKWGAIRLQLDKLAADQERRRANEEAD